MFKITVVVGLMVLAIMVSSVVASDTFAGDTVSDDLPNEATSEDDDDSCPPGQSPLPAAAGVGGCESDLDDDGILDQKDNCPVNYNPNQETPMVCRGIEAEKDPIKNLDTVTAPRTLSEDVIPADLPNQATPNPDPEEDLFPESCEGAPGCDDDQDGVPDTEDNCPKSPNADQNDSDGDGIGDSCQSIPEEPEDPPPTPQCVKRTDHWDPNTGTCVPTFGNDENGGASTNEPPRPLPGETDGPGSTGGVIEDPDLPPPIILRSDGQRQSSIGGNSANQGIGQSQSQLPTEDNLPDVCPDGTEPKSTDTDGTMPKCPPAEIEQTSTDQSQKPSGEQPPVPESETQNDEMQQSPEEDNSEDSSEDNSEDS